ncbi:MAG: hypothetical protein J6L76_04685 [Clostridia bacterium]|nr:hypothetical protein [Clostridia bacterium]
MKKLAVILAILFLFSCVSCSRNEVAHTPTTEPTIVPTAQTSALPHQTLTVQTASFDFKNLRVSIPEVGLHDVYICDTSSGSVLLDTLFFGHVYLLGDPRNRPDMLDYYLAIVDAETGKIYVQDLLAYEDQINYGGSIELGDVDGDGDCEIILQETVGLIGGAGSYLSRILDYQDGKIVELFSTAGVHDFSNGFSIELQENHHFTIRNAQTGYSETFLLEGRADAYFEGWYDANGQIAKRELILDSFSKFVPWDVDDDGVCEIICHQYASLIGHADGIGTGKIILKYNTTTASFEIIQADFAVFQPIA